LNRRIRDRFESVRKGYEDFLKQHPRHAKARIAYGSFLSDINDEDARSSNWGKSLEIDTNTPSVYNNLANIYGHPRPGEKAFDSMPTLSS